MAFTNLPTLEAIHRGETNIVFGEHTSILNSGQNGTVLLPTRNQDNGQFTKNMFTHFQSPADIMEAEFTETQEEADAKPIVPIEDSFVLNSHIADLSVFESLQSVQNERFEAATPVENILEYGEAGGQRFKLSPKSMQLEKELGAAELELRKQATEYIKVYAAWVDPVPDKVTQYTHVKQTDAGWEDAVKKYKNDLRSKTMPKYESAVDTALEKVKRIAVAKGDSVSADAQAATGRSGVFAVSYKDLMMDYGDYTVSKLQSNIKKHMQKLGLR